MLQRRSAAANCGEQSEQKVSQLVLYNWTRGERQRYQSTIKIGASRRAPFKVAAQKKSRGVAQPAIYERILCEQ